jgi:hypothetical protein
MHVYTHLANPGVALIDVPPFAGGGRFGKLGRAATTGFGGGFGAGMVWQQASTQFEKHYESVFSTK